MLESTIREQSMERRLVHAFNVYQAAELLSLMGNEARLRVLLLICEHEIDVGSLAREIDMSQSALSQHLKKLRDGNLVSTRRQTQTVYYSCGSEAVAKVLRTLVEIYSTPNGNVSKKISII